jgi:Ribonucleotide synthetase preATP-grasp domain
VLCSLLLSPTKLLHVSSPSLLKNSWLLFFTHRSHHFTVRSPRFHVFSGARTHKPQTNANTPTDAAEGHVAAYSDERALSKFAGSVDVVTYEFENVPLDCARFLAKYCPLRPSCRLLEVCQNRILEKVFLSEAANQATAEYLPSRCRSSTHNTNSS